MDKARKFSIIHSIHRSIDINTSLVEFKADYLPNIALLVQQYANIKHSISSSVVNKLLIIYLKLTIYLLKIIYFRSKPNTALLA